ncbi:MAG: rod shape-determining protein [Vampirovibrionales bacterium]
MAFSWLPFSKQQANQHDLGVDLGTVNTLICTPQKGIVLCEPSVVAIDHTQSPPQLIEVGYPAKEMMGRTPSHIEVNRPLRDGVIADSEWAELMLRKFIEKVLSSNRFFAPRPNRVVVGIPSGVRPVDRRILAEAAFAVGAHSVHLVEEPMAAAIGAGLPIMKPFGSMVVDIGGGTTDIAVLSLNGLVVSRSLKVAGDHLNQQIIHYLQEERQLEIGERTAEEVKISLSSAMSTDELLFDEMEVRGLNRITNLPDIIRVQAGEIRECLKHRLYQIIDSVKKALEETPPELAADIKERGMILTGGGAQLPGFASLISEETGVPVHIAKDPLHCVVLGTQRVLSDPEFHKVLEYTEYTG